MKPVNLFAILILPALYILLCTGCKREVVTNYYADEQTPELAILSNKGNNLMTCFFDGVPWRTQDRIVGYHPQTELAIRRIHTSSTMDTITIKWDSDYNQYDIQLSLPVSKNFEWKDFSSYAGRRIIIDSSNGYFSLIQNSYFNVGNGKGTIYFNMASVDSVSPINIKGRISGLLEAHINLDFIANPHLVNITSGRFDDEIGGFELLGF